MVEQLPGNNQKLQWNPEYVQQGDVRINWVSILSELPEKPNLRYKA